MLRNISTQTKIMLNKTGFKASFTIVMVFCMAEVVMNSFGVKYMRGLDDGFVGNDPSSVITTFEAFMLCEPSNMLSFIRLLFPFLCALPFSFSLLTDKLTNTDVLFCAYGGKGRYVVSKAAATFIGSFVIFFVPLLIQLGLNYMIFDSSMGADIFNPNWNFSGWGVMRATDYPCAPFGNILARSPFLFSLMYCGMFSLMSGVFGVFALACSVFCRRNKVMSFAAGFLVLNILQYADDYAMNGDIDEKYTVLDPFSYITFYYHGGAYGLNYKLFYIFLGILLVISALILAISARTDYI